jgi:hypothetical protein
MAIDSPTPEEKLRDSVERALEDAGLEGVAIRSIHVELAQRVPKCPPGMQPVWERTSLPDGSTIFQWVCRWP